MWSEVRKRDEVIKKSVILTESMENFQIAEEKNKLIESTKTEFSVEKNDLKKQVQEYFGWLEVSPEQMEKVSKEVYKFTMDCQFAYSALNYLGAMYDVEARMLGYDELRKRQQSIANQKGQLIELMRNPLGSRELITDASRASFLSQPALFFQQRREEIRFNWADTQMPTGPRVGQIGISSRMGSLSWKTKLFIRWIKEVFATKGKRKNEAFYKDRSNELQKKIYEHMNWFWENMLGSAEISRKYAGTLQDEMFNQMIEDDEILNKIKVSSLFYYYRPVKMEDQPKASIHWSDGEMIDCTLQYLRSDNWVYLLCHRDAWSKDAADGSKEYVYEEPSDLTGYTKDRVTCKYIKTDDGYEQSQKSWKVVYNVSQKHGLPEQLIWWEWESCNIDSVEYEGKEMTLLQAEAKFAQVPSFLQRIWFPETDAESGKRLTEVVNLAASNIYFDLVKDLQKGKRPAVLWLSWANIDFNDFNDELMDMDQNLLDAYVAKAIGNYCEKYNVIWPDGQETPWLSEAFEAALLRIHDDPTIKNLAAEFSNTANVRENTTKAVITNEFLDVLTDPNLVDAEHRGICATIAHKIYDWKGLGIMPWAAVWWYDLSTWEIDRSSWLKVNDGNHTLSAKRIGDQLHIRISDNGIEAKPAPYATQWTKTYTRALNIPQKIRETQNANIKAYSYLFSWKLFQNGLEIFSEQVNGHTSELGYKEDEWLRSKSIVSQYSESHPYRKTYTELVWTGERNADVFEVGKNYDTAKTFAKELALFAASGWPAWRLAFATIRGLWKVVQTGNYLSKWMHFRQALRFSYLSNAAIQSNKWLRLSHRTLTWLYFHPIVTTLKAWVDEEFREQWASEMTNASRYIHSVLTMHILWPIGGVAQAAQKNATNTLMKWSVLTLWVGAEVWALLWLNHAFELVLPESHNMETTDQSLVEEIGHTLAMVIWLRLVHLPLKKPLAPWVKEKITITEVNKWIPTGKIEIGDAVFLINKWNIEPLNRKSREMLSQEWPIDGVQAAKYSPLIKKVESLYQWQSKRRSASWEETADNFNPRMTAKARRAKIKEEIIAEQKSQNPKEAERLEKLTEEQRSSALDKFMEAHKIDQKTGEIVNSEYGLEAQSKGALRAKIKKAQEWYDILAIEGGEITRILLEKGLLWEYGFIFERTVAKAIGAKKFNNRAEAAWLDTFQHDAINTNKTSFDAKAQISWYGEWTNKIARHEYKWNVWSVTTSMNAQKDVLTVSYAVTSWSNTTNKTITYKLRKPDGTRSTNKLMKYDGAWTFVLWFNGRATKKDLADLQRYIEANKTDMVEVTKDARPNKIATSSFWLLAKNDLAIKTDKNGKTYIYEWLRVWAHGPTAPWKSHIGWTEMNIYGNSSWYSRNELYRMEVRREFNAEFAKHIETVGYYTTIHNAGQTHAGLTVTSFQFKGETHRVTYKYEPNKNYHEIQVDYKNMEWTSGLRKNNNQDPFVLLRIFPKPL